MGPFSSCLSSRLPVSGRLLCVGLVADAVVFLSAARNNTGP
jgi:hypothetical protein